MYTFCGLFFRVKYVLHSIVCIGLASRSARQCVMALTICTLEMRDAMVKLLPEVLLNLSKISATVLIAIPILEFLSSKLFVPQKVCHSCTYEHVHFTKSVYTSGLKLTNS